MLHQSCKSRLGLGAGCAKKMVAKTVVVVGRKSSSGRRAFESYLRVVVSIVVAAKVDAVIASESCRSKKGKKRHEAES